MDRKIVSLEDWWLLGERSCASQRLLEWVLDQARTQDISKMPQPCASEYLINLDDESVSEEVDEELINLYAGTYIESEVSTIRDLVAFAESAGSYSEDLICFGRPRAPTDEEGIVESFLRDFAVVFEQAAMSAQVQGNNSHSVVAVNGAVGDLLVFQEGTEDLIVFDEDEDLMVFEDQVGSIKSSTRPLTTTI
ncbi:hypothetical protein ACHAPT_001490 [Fusarium lateritium]